MTGSILYDHRRGSFDGNKSLLMEGVRDKGAIFGGKNTLGNTHSMDELDMVRVLLGLRRSQGCGTELFVVDNGICRHLHKIGDTYRKVFNRYIAPRVVGVPVEIRL